MPAGDLYINFHHASKPATNYKRVLHMDKGMVEVEYRVDNVFFRREVFTSWEHRVMVTHLNGGPGRGVY